MRAARSSCCTTSAAPSATGRRRRTGTCSTCSAKVHGEDALAAARALGGRRPARDRGLPPGSRTASTAPVRRLGVVRTRARARRERARRRLPRRRRRARARARPDPQHRGGARDGARRRRRQPPRRGAAGAAVRAVGRGLARLAVRLTPDAASYPSPRYVLRTCSLTFSSAAGPSSATRPVSST